jgi:hypothetical protein
MVSLSDGCLNCVARCEQSTRRITDRCTRCQRLPTKCASTSASPSSSGLSVSVQEPPPALISHPSSPSLPFRPIRCCSAQTDFIRDTGHTEPRFPPMAKLTHHLHAGSIHAILVIMRLMNNPPPNYVEAPMSQQPYGVQPIPVMIVPGPNSPPAPGAPGAPGASQPQPQPQPQSQNQNQGGGNVPPGASAPSPPVYPGYAYYEQSPGPINSWTPREHRQLPDLSYGGRMQWEDRPGATSSAATSPEKQNSPLPESAPLL